MNVKRTIDIVTPRNKTGHSTSHSNVDWLVMCCNYTILFMHGIRTYYMHQHIQKCHRKQREAKKRMQQCHVESMRGRKWCQLQIAGQVSHSMLVTLSLCHLREIWYAVVRPLDLLKLKISLRLMMLLSHCEDQSVKHQFHVHWSNRLLLIPYCLPSNKIIYYHLYSTNTALYDNWRCYCAQK